MAEFSGRPQETNQTTIVQTQIYRITTGKETIVVTTATNYATTSPTTTTTTTRTQVASSNPQRQFLI